MLLQHILNTFTTHWSNISWTVSRFKEKKGNEAKNSLSQFCPLRRSQARETVYVLYSETKILKNSVNVTFDNGEFLTPCMYHWREQLCWAIMTTFCAGQSLSRLIILINVGKSGQRVYFVKRYAFLHIWTNYVNKWEENKILRIFQAIFCGCVHFWVKVWGCLMRHSSHLILLKIAQNCPDGR